MPPRRRLTPGQRLLKVEASLVSAQKDILKVVEEWPSRLPDHLINLVQDITVARTSVSKVIRGNK